MSLGPLVPESHVIVVQRLRMCLRLALLISLLTASASPLLAWPAALEESLYRDAQRLLPRSLALLLHDRERAVLAASRASSPEMTGLKSEIAAGRLSPPTLLAIDTQLRDVATLMQRREFSAGLLRLGTLLRVAADVSDPVLASAEPVAPEVAVEYYAFVQAHLDKIPVVLNDRRALGLRREELPEYWQSLLVRSREDAPVLSTELFAGGRIVRHETLDYRSPVFGVGSLAYSRAVNGIAATWLAGWRSVRGDMGQMREPEIVSAKERADLPNWSFIR